MKKLLCLSVFLILFSVAAAPVIVYSQTATAAENTAVQELADHLKKILGKPVSCVREGEKFISDCPIYVGQTKFASTGTNLKNFGPEESLIQSSGKALVITGGRPRGTLYGVYEFLERYLGVRWYFPGDKGMVIPPCKNLSVTRLFENGSPAFSTRTLFCGRLPKESGIPVREYNTWLRRMRFGGKILSPIANHGFQWVYKK
jgi:hypothetical protein